MRRRIKRKGHFTNSKAFVGFDKRAELDWTKEPGARSCSSDPEQKAKAKCDSEKLQQEGVGREVS